MSQWNGIDEAVAVAECGSFAGAAARLGASTSHVSRAIARLEDRLGAPLFHRTTRRVSLTDTGRTFTDHCRRLIQEREELLSYAAGTGEPQGEVRVTCAVSLGERFIAPIVGDFVERFPRVSVTLDLTNGMIDLIAEGYDIGVRTRQLADSRLAGREIAYREVLTCASPGYLARHGIPASVADLSGHQLLGGVSPSWHFLNCGTPFSVAPTSRWRCNSGTAVTAAAIAGRGICQLPAFYVRRHLTRGELVQILPDCQTAPEPIWIVYPRRRHLLPRLSLLVREIEAALQPAIDAA